MIELPVISMDEGRLPEPPSSDMDEYLEASLEVVTAYIDSPHHKRVTRDVESEKRAACDSDLQKELGWVRFEMNITYRCNTVCKWCNRLVGVIDVSDSDIMPEQVERMLDELYRRKMVPYRIKLSGGEAAENEHLGEIVRIMNDALPIQTGWVLTNGTKPSRRGSFGLPKPWKWIRSPLTNNKIHQPFLVSPEDIGLGDQTGDMDKPCYLMNKCGTCFDAWGFSNCAVAGSLGRVLRINPYTKTPPTKRRADLCRHCIYALPKELGYEVQRKAEAGEYSHPTPTFREGLRKWREEGPMEYERY